MKRRLEKCLFLQMSMLTRLEQALFSTGCRSATALLWCTAVSGDRAVQRHAVLCNRVTAGCGMAKAGAKTLALQVR